MCYLVEESLASNLGGKKRILAIVQSLKIFKLWIYLFKDGDNQTANSSVFFATEKTNLLVFWQKSARFEDCFRKNQFTKLLRI